MNEHAPTRTYPPGWYPDPEMVGTQRYYDGTAWTAHRAPGTPARPQNNKSLISAGYICAILIPIVGLVIGVVLMGRNEKDGGRILAISIVILSLLALALSSGP